MRVHTLAKEYGIKATEFVDIIQEFGIEITSHLNALNENQIEHIKKSMLQKSFEEEQKTLVEVFKEDEPKEEIETTNISAIKSVEIEDSLFVKFLKWIKGK